MPSGRGPGRPPCGQDRGARSGTSRRAGLPERPTRSGPLVRTLAPCPSPPRRVRRRRRRRGARCRRPARAARSSRCRPPEPPRRGPPPRRTAPPPRPPRVRRPWWSSAGTVGAVALAAFAALSAMSFASNARGTGATAVDALALVVGLTGAGFLVARRRWAVPIVLASSVATPLLPLPWVFAAASRRIAWACTVVVAGATAVALWRDASRPPPHMILSLTDQATGEVLVASPVALVVLGVSCVGAAVAAGLVRASRAQTERAVAD